MLESGLDKKATAYFSSIVGTIDPRMWSAKMFKVLVEKNIDRHLSLFFFLWILHSRYENINMIHYSLYLWIRINFQAVIVLLRFLKFTDILDSLQLYVNQW